LVLKLLEEEVDLAFLCNGVIDLRQLDPLLEVFAEAALELARHLALELLEDVTDVPLEHLGLLVSLVDHRLKQVDDVGDHFLSEKFVRVYALLHNV